MSKVARLPEDKSHGNSTYGEEDLRLELGKFVPKKEIERYLTKHLQGFRLLGCITGGDPPERLQPNPADYAPEEQIFLEVDYKEYKDNVNNDLQEQLEITDLILSLRDEAMTDWMDKRFGNDVLESREMPPHTGALMDWIIEAMLYQPGKTKKEILKELVNKLVALRSCGMKQSETLLNFYHRFKDVIDQLAAIDGNSTPNDAAQASDFVTGLDPVRFFEFKAKYAEAESNLPEDENEEEMALFKRIYKKVYAFSLTEAYEKARDYKLTWQSLVKESEQVPIKESEHVIEARKKIDRNYDDKESSSKNSESVFLCDLCGVRGHGVRTCKMFARAKLLLQVDQKKPLLPRDHVEVKESDDTHSANPFLEVDF